MLPLGMNGFTGYAEMTAANYFPALVMGTAPLLPMATATYTYAMVPTTAGPIVGQAYGVTLDPAKGQVVVFVNNCNGKLASGATITAAGSAKVGYTVNATPNATATATDSSGVAFALNVDPGSVQVTGTVAQTKAVIATGTALVRAGYVTEIFFVPTP
jgi:hypothetical protein